MPAADQDGGRGVAGKKEWARVLQVLIGPRDGGRTIQPLCTTLFKYGLSRYEQRWLVEVTDSDEISDIDFD